MRDLVRLKKMGPFSPETSMLRNYIEFVVELPWNVASSETLDIPKARKVFLKHLVIKALTVCKKFFLNCCHKFSNCSYYLKDETRLLPIASVPVLIIPFRFKFKTHC